MTETSIDQLEAEQSMFVQTAQGVISKDGPLTLDLAHPLDTTLL